MAAGFASETTDFSAPYEYKDDNVVMIRLRDGEADLETVTLSFEGTPRSGPVALVLDGENYTLERDEDTNTLSLSTPDVSIVDDLIFSQSNTGAYYIGRDFDDEFLGGYYIFGHDSDPADIGLRNGLATFEGIAGITLRNNENAGFGFGDVTLEIDFDRNTIGGDGFVTDDLQDDATLTFPDIEIALNETPITGNGFSGTTDAQSAATGDTFSDGTFSGRFYDDGAQVAAGQFSGTIDAPGIENTLPYEGVFIAQE